MPDLTPYLELNNIYNAMNWNFSERRGGGACVVSAMNGSTANCDLWGLMNATATANQISAISLSVRHGQCQSDVLHFYARRTAERRRQDQLPFNAGLIRGHRRGRADKRAGVLPQLEL